jgi:6,7-dimethyl-8-ribityllumazine synthase
VKIRPARLGIVAAEFNKALVDAMVEAARAQAKEDGASVTQVVRVPGCYEVPLVTERLLARRDTDGVVVLGYIEQGETLHGEVMGHVVHASLLEMERRARKPIGIGIIGPGATPVQAEVRKIDYARAAVRALLRSREAIAALGRAK